MNHPRIPDRHLDEAELLRHLEGETETSAGVTVHLQECAACAERANQLEKERAAVAALLHELSASGAPATRRDAALTAMVRAQERRARSRLRHPALVAAAAVFLFLLGVGAGTATARGFIAGGIEHIAALLQRNPVQGESSASANASGSLAEAPLEVTTSANADDPPAGRGGVSFTPSSDELLIRFRSMQREGLVTLWIRNARQVRAERDDGGDPAIFLPGPQALEVANERGSAASYSIVVPSHLRRVRIQVGNGPDAVIPVVRARPEWIWTYNLAAPGRTDGGRARK